MKNFFKEAKKKFGLLDLGHSRLLEQHQKRVYEPKSHTWTDWDAWAEHGVRIEHIFGGKVMKYTHEYFAIVSMGQFLMKGETKFFHDLAHAQLFNSRAEAGAFMREWKISGCVVRVTCEFTAHGV